MRTALALAVLLSGASPAFAQCLTSADLARGVVVGFQSGDRTFMRMMEDGYLQIDETYADGSPTIRFRAHRGIYFTEEYELGANGQPAPGSRLVIEFPVNPAKLPEPAPGAGWTGQTTNVFEDGYRRAETTTFTYTAAPSITLSGCTYDAVNADLRYDWGTEGGLTLRYVYLPALQTAILLSNQFDGDQLASTTPVSLTLSGK